MKTLHEILHDAMILLGDPRVLHVEIARGDHEPLDGYSSAYQIRLHRDVYRIRCETRAWLGGQWDRWREYRGWLGGGGVDIADVLATDWRIIA